MKRTTHKFNEVTSFSRQLLALIPYWFGLAFLLVFPLIAHSDCRQKQIYKYLPAPQVTVIRSSKRRDDDDEIDPRDMPAGTKVFVYLRTSPGLSQTPDSQVSAVKKLVIEKGWVLDEKHIFTDFWVSGKSADRKSFEWMIYLSRQKPRPADLLIIWDFSRFARDQDQSLLYTAELRINGWKILSMNDDIPSGSMSRIYEALIHWKNEQYLNDLRAHTIRGLFFVAEQGCVPVGPICTGYTSHEVFIGTYKDGTPRMGRKPEIDPGLQQLIVRAFEMRAQGAPHRAIAEATGLYEPDSSAWDHFFRNKTFISEYEFRGEVFRPVYPPLMSRELFEAVQQVLPKPKVRNFAGRNHPRRKRGSFFLANIAACAYCGGEMYGKSIKKNNKEKSYRYYICKRHDQNIPSCPDSGPVRADLVEPEILRILLNHVLHPEYLQQLLDWTNECLGKDWEDLTLRMEKTRTERDEAKRQGINLFRKAAEMDTTVDFVQEELVRQQASIKQLNSELEKLEKELANSRIKATPEQIAHYIKQAQGTIDRKDGFNLDQVSGLEQAQDIIDQAEFFDLRAICEQLCSRVVMSPEQCTVELHFPDL